MGNGAKPSSISLLDGSLWYFAFFVVLCVLHVLFLELEPELAFVVSVLGQLFVVFDEFFHFVFQIFLVFGRPTQTQAVGAEFTA